MSSDDSVVPRVAAGRWVVVLVIAMGGPVGTAAGDIEVQLGLATASVDLAAEFPGGGGPSNSGLDGITDPATDFSAFIHITTLGTNFLGEGAAYQDQFGINAVYVDSRSALPEAEQFTGLAESRYHAYARHTGPTAGQTIDLFEFEINSGEVRIRNFAELVRSADPTDPPAYVEAAITLTQQFSQGGTGQRAWRFYAGIDTDGTNPILTDEGRNKDEFGINVHPTLTLEWEGADVVVRIPQVIGSIPLNDTVNMGFEYEMKAGLNLVTDLGTGIGCGGVAGITDPFALGAPDGPAVALGDQFSKDGVVFYVDGQPISQYTVIPEPRALLLLAMALALAAARRWRWTT